MRFAAPLNLENIPIAMPDSCKRSCGKTIPPDPASAEPCIHITAGTAGHIDHGKTSLVKWLTGCDTDRLPEEKARGMTIDLGFAPCILPNGRRVGIVDVPGHERFIHNMVAGATGIDVVVLVIAADDGIMPQTIEHFHIVRLLGVRRGMIVVTKTDMVPPERTQEVMEQARVFTMDSFLAGCRIVPFSSKTGAGFDAFFEAFSDLVDETAARDANGPFRLHVERAFVLKGQGIIASGIPRSGCARVGDTLELLPKGGLKRIRSLQVYGEPATQAVAGQCVALKMADLAADEIARGCVLAAPGYFEPLRFVNARFQMLHELERPLESRTAIRLHLGTADVPGHLLLPTVSRLEPGGESYVQIQLHAPVVAAPGDPFVLRLLSPVRTLGGGYVVEMDHQRIRRSKGVFVGHCEESDQAFKNPDTALEYVFRHAGLCSLRLPEAAKDALLDEAASKTAAAALQQAGKLVHLDSDRYAHCEAMTQSQASILERMNQLHSDQPMAAGFSRIDALRAIVEDKRLLESAVARLLAAGDLAEHNGLFSIPAKAPKLSSADAALSESILRVFREKAFASPRPNQLPALLDQPQSKIEPLLKLLQQTGELVLLPDNILLHKDVLEVSRQKLVDTLKTRERVDAAGFKEILNTSRKYAIPILEYWDRKGLTRRVGDFRVLA